MARKRRSRASRTHSSASADADADHLLGSSLDDSYLDNLLAGLDRLAVSPSTVAEVEQQHSFLTAAAAAGSSARRRSNRPALHPITSVPTSPAAAAAAVAGIGHAGTPLHVPATPPSAVSQTPPATGGSSTKSGKRGRKASTATSNDQHRPPQVLLRPRPVSPSPLPLHPTATHDSDSSDIDLDDPAILAATAAQRRRREQKRAKRSSKRQQQQQQPPPALVIDAVEADEDGGDSDVDLSDTESIVELRMEVEAMFVHSQMQVLCPWYLPMFDIVKVEREEGAERGSPEYGTGGLGGFVGARSEQLERLGKWGHPRWDCLVPVPEEGDEWRWVVSMGDE
ncbi:hypothetical protein BCR44DRAFT_35911 [Catenaria anguillulae PL171]|uniref:Uncharacterized protein n=1 Tax=Catenaria anguillulae PL171 TaxID=765915 RepID=A0A1Y2HEY6_9FUNG|nr:hypothetical protein BCR44DRAFT_35911 [Catenaria anguillulae PL171]